MKSKSELIALLELKKINKLVLKARQFECKEALVMSGERPDEFKVVKDQLKDIGCNSFFDYLIFVCKSLLDENLLPHTNVGDLSFEELKKLKIVNASMGLMLESSNASLTIKGGVHQESPSKTPQNRINFIRNAGKLKIPFTTGLLLGIGETMIDRIKDLFLIKELNEKYGHIQEIIIQNFVQKPNIHYHPKNPITMEEVIKTAGLAKVISKNTIKIQVPPNLIAGYEKEFIRIGVDDFGGISPFSRDEINPNKPWPEVEHLKKICKESGMELKERLPIYDKFISDKEFVSPHINKVIETINY